MIWVSFTKDTDGVVVHYSRNGFARKHVGLIRKTSEGYVLHLKDDNVRLTARTLTEAKAHARNYYGHTS